MPKKYNLIMITLDGARFDRLKLAPNFRGLMGMGAVFDNMITYGPQTVTSLYAIFSGIYGHINGVNNYFLSYKFKKDKIKTFPQYLKDLGMITRADIINPMVMPHQGFDEVLIHNEREDDLSKKHTGLLREVNNLRKENKNFFLYLHYSNIHTGFIETVVKKFKDFGEDYFNEEGRKRNIKNYDKLIGKADEYLKKIMDTVKELNLLDDTIFIILSDHGTSIGEKPGEIGYGRYCYDYSLKTFAIFIQKDLFPKKEISSMCRTIDIFPTILDLYEIKADKELYIPEGESLLPLIYGKDSERYAFSEASGIEEKPENHPPLVRSLRDPKWKFIIDYQKNKEELYNLENDPGEENNLAEKKTDIVKNLREKLNCELRKSLSLKISSLKETKKFE